MLTLQEREYIVSEILLLFTEHSSPLTDGEQLLQAILKRKGPSGLQRVVIMRIVDFLYSKHYLIDKNTINSILQDAIEEQKKRLTGKNLTMESSIVNLKTKS